MDSLFLSVAATNLEEVFSIPTLLAMVFLGVLSVLLLIEKAGRRKAESAIRHEHELFGQGPVVLFKWGAMEGWPVEYVSPNVSQFGYSPEDLTAGNITFLEIIWPEDRGRIATEVQEHLEAGVASFEQRYRIKHADGRPRWLYDITHVVRGDAGDVTHLVGYVLDVTERREVKERERQLEKKLVRAERLEALGKLAGGVAHDLNNILGPLVGYPSLILKELPPESPVRSTIEEIRSSACRAAAVIQDLLALSRRGVFQVQPVDLNQIIDSYLQSAAFKMLADRHAEVHVQTELYREGPLCLSGSASHLSRVLMNLVLNGFEAMDGEGVLSISTAKESVGNSIEGAPAQPGEYVVLKVSDNGCGMSRAEMERMFDPFFTKNKMGRSGTGLGLAVVYGVIEDHLGYIDVQSEPGHGSSFTLYFPEASGVPEAEADSTTPRGGSERILIVDDREDQRTLCSRLLSGLGYDVATAKNGHAAIEYIKHHDVDLILLDMIMEEGFDGLDTYRELASIKPGLKCVLLSGYAETERVLQAQDLGAGAYLRKPYTLRRLDQVVRKELEREVAVEAG